MKYFNTDKLFWAVSNESPQGFKDLLFVARACDGSETVLTPEKIKLMTPVAPEDLPADVRDTFGLPVIEVEVEVEVNNDEAEREQMFHAHLAAGEDLDTAVIASGHKLGDPVEFRAEPGDIRLVVFAIMAITIFIIGVLG
jgi:hypothetical protein